MLDDVGAVTTVSDCDGCAVAEASAMAQGCLVQCACKRMYGPDDATWPREERPSHVALAAPMVRELARAVAGTPRWSISGWAQW